MQVDRHAQGDRALEDRRKERIVQITAPRMAVDVGALEPGLADAALEFLGRLVGRLDRQRRKAGEPRRSPPKAWEAVVIVGEKIKPIEVIAYSPKEAARVIGRSHTRVKKAIRERELTARKDGRATLIEHTELLRWVANLPTIGRKPDPAPANGAPSAPRPPISRHPRHRQGEPAVGAGGARGRRNSSAALIR